MSVLTIGYEAFSYCDNLTEVIIPATVTSIGEKAFSYCDNLTEVTISNSVTSISNSELTIGSWAFQNCKSLKEVSIGDSVTSIGNNAFEGCSGLTDVSIGDSVLTIGSWAFSYCTSLTDVKIPYKVTSIGDYTFSDCSSLANVTIPDFVKSIGAGAFFQCTSLKEVTIPDFVTIIGKGAFSKCSSLTNVTIPDLVTSIGDGVFFMCTSLTNVTIPNSVLTIGRGAFLKSGITDIHVTKHTFDTGKFDLNTLNKDIDEKVKFRGRYMKIHILRYFTATIDARNDTIIFQNGGALTKTDVSNSGLTTNTNIKYVYIEHHTSIGSEAFLDCSGIEKITIPATVTDISENAFKNAFSEDVLGIKIVVDELNTTYHVADGALYRNTPERIGSRLIKLPINSYHSNITNLTSYKIPDYTHSIADYAFYNRKSINTITVPPLVRSIGTRAFETNTDPSEKNVTINMSNFTLYYLNKYYDLSMSPDFSYNSIETSYTANNFFGADVASLNITLDTEFRINTSDSSNILESIDVSGNKKNVVVSNYQSIAADCFENNNNMEYIALENSIDCSLNTIGSGAFANCSNLQQVLYADEEHIELYNKNKDQEYKIQSAYNTINDLSGNEDVSGIFQNCVSLGRFNVPKNVATIPHYAFKDCYNLVVVQMAENTKTIHNEAFENCYLLRFLQLLSVTNLGENIASTSFITDVTIPNELDNLTNVDMEEVLTNLSISNIKTIKLTQNALSNANQQSN